MVDFLSYLSMKNEPNTAFRISKIIIPFLVFGFFGIFSVLLDLDHIPVLLEKGIEINPSNIITYAGRPLHLSILIILGIICVYLAARLYRLHNSRH